MTFTFGPRRIFAGRRVRGAAVAAVIGSSVLGLFAVGTAPASAVTTPAACDTTWISPVHWTAETSVNLRQGSSTSSISLGILTKGTKFTEYCVDKKGTYWWGWGKVTSGPNAGKYGWVYRQYLT